MALLEIRNINHFFGGLRAVHEFSLNFEDGEFVGLIGPNGAGKTTVFNLVSGFYSPTEGEILFQGKNISGLRPHAVTSLGLARTFQNIRLWQTMTVFENLCMSQHCRLGYGFLDSILWTKKYRNNEKGVFRTAEELLDILVVAVIVGVVGIGTDRRGNDQPWLERGCIVHGNDADRIVRARTIVAVVFIVRFA